MAGPGDGRGQMRFPRAGAADQYQVLRRFHKYRRGQLFHHRLRERRLVPVDAEQVAANGEASRFEWCARFAWGDGVAPTPGSDVLASHA